MNLSCDKCGADTFPASVGGLCLSCWSERETANAKHVDWAERQSSRSEELNAILSDIPDSIERHCAVNRLIGHMLADIPEAVWRRAIEYVKAKVEAHAESPT